METLIQPKTLKGFRDLLPDDAALRDCLMETLAKVFRSRGFVPIDTPALEYSEILLRKSEGETEKQMFRFRDNGERDVALRFDLTVPFARYVAMRKDSLYFPFKRYHMAKVWRGEKPQAGRYREFTQCDFDIVGSDSASADFETLALIKASLDALGAGRFTIKISHRGVFNRFLARLGLSEKSEDVLRAVDKLSKAGEESVAEELSSLAGDAAARDALEYVKSLSSFDETLAHIEEMAGGRADDTDRIRAIREMMEACGIAESFSLDPSITRGLDYYTGVVCETFLDDLPSIGSVCSGGRYDNLTGLYMKERMPGVGASVGLDRLMAAAERLGSSESRAPFVDAEIFCQDASLACALQKAAASLRAAGAAVEVFPDSAKMARQYSVAEKKSIPWGVFVSAEEAKNNLMTLKNLKTRETFEGLSAARAAEKILASRWNG